ncbi:MAG TPA: TonB family protein [Bacteroidales bacterium]|nr:TonB family protein [Bacteroidales bacterium]
MAKKIPISPLLTPSGCLTSQTIRSFLEGSLSVDDQNIVLDHLDTCRFCQDAVEGLTGGKNSRVTDREIASLNQQILEMTSAASSRRLRPVTGKISVMKTWTVAAAAASVVLFIGIFLLLRQPGSDHPEALIALKDTTPEKSVQIPHNEQGSVTEAPKVVTREDIAPREKSQPEPVASRPPSTEIIPTDRTEPSEIPAEELASAVRAYPATDSLAQGAETDQAIIIEMEDITVAEPPAVVEGVALGRVSAGKSKSALRTVNVSREMPQGEEIFTVAEHWPEFPGGQDSLDAFLHRNLRYPEQALAVKTEGTVYLSFVVETDGSLSDIKVLRGLSPECAQEAIRLVNSMPLWIPGRQKNTPVRVQYHLPIQFQLPD